MTMNIRAWLTDLHQRSKWQGSFPADVLGAEALEAIKSLDAAAETDDFARRTAKWQQHRDAFLDYYMDAAKRNFAYDFDALVAEAVQLGLTHVVAQNVALTKALADQIRNSKEPTK